MSSKKSSIKLFSSFKEQELFELNEMSKLSSKEILAQLRKLINLAYGMKQTLSPPTQHKISNIQYLNY